jgi:hypothetical protein
VTREISRRLADMTKLEWLFVSGAVMHYQMRMKSIECPHNLVPCWPEQEPVLKKFQQIMSEVCGDLFQDREEYAASPSPPPPAP